MKNTVIRLRRETSNSLYSTQNNGLVGYLLKITIQNYLNIDPNIFVMQRDLNSSFSEEPVDTFYSIASVGELETLSVNSPNSTYNNFYRTNEIELMFETPQDLENAWKSISAEVRSLVEANDASINTEPDMVASYPVDAFLRYYGSSTISSPTQTAIQNFKSDNFYGLEYPIQDFLELTQQEYYYFASTNLNVVPYIFVDDAPVSYTTASIDITNKYGLVVPYKLFKTVLLDIGSRKVLIKSTP